MKKTKFFFVALSLITIAYLTCTNENSTFNPTGSDDPVFALCAVSKTMPDSSLTYKEIIDSSLDSVGVTINDSLYFIGFVTDSNVISNLKGYWLFGDNSVDTGFGIIEHDYDSSGEYLAKFIILDELGNSDTETVKIFISDEIPLLSILSSDTIINIEDTILLNAMFSDDGKIIKILVNDSLVDAKDTLVWKSTISDVGSTFVVVEILDDDSHSVSDSMLVYVNSIPDSLKLLTPGDTAKAQSVNPVFTWVGYDHDYYDTSLVYSLITIMNGSEIDTVLKNSKAKEHTLATALSKGETVIWYVVAEDMYGKTVVSDTFSFTTISDEATSGALEGYVYREGFEGVSGNTGIGIKAFGSGSEKGSAVSDSLGYYFIENLTGAITLVFQDYGFKAESTIVSIVNGDTVTVSSDTLSDTLPPILQLAYDSVVKIGADVNISWIVKDTFYSVDSVLVNFDSGDLNMESTDTTISFDSSGDYEVMFIAYDHNGNVALDTAKIHVNYPPSSVSLISPISNANVAVNTSVPFKWSCVDNDNKNDVTYDIYIGVTPTLSDTDIEASSISDTSYLLGSSGDTWLTYYWKVIAYDGYDTIESTIDSFKVGEYTTGRLEGYALLQGMDNHTGIKLIAESQIDTLSYEIFVNDSGYFFADILPRTYTLTARDTLHKVFTNDAVSVAVIANDTVAADTMILLDTLAPHIACTYPTQGDTLKSLSPRNITVTGTFSDTGSQVKPDSVVILLNSDTVKTATVTPSLWSFEINPIADGDYVVFVSAKDGAGHEDTLTRSFYVNSKIINASISFSHDSMICDVQIENQLPSISNYKFNFDAHNNSVWDLTETTNDTAITVVNLLSHPPVPGSGTLIVSAQDDSGMIVFDTVNYVIPNNLTYFTWEDAIAYHVIIDRFKDGYPVNEQIGGTTSGTADASNDYMGGDLVGIKEMIESGYFTDLGVNLLIISCPVDNIDTVIQSSSRIEAPYLGHWPDIKDYAISSGIPSPLPEVESKFGTNNDLKNLVDAAHNQIAGNGFPMKVIIEYVPKHTYIESEIYNNKPDWFVEKNICGTDIAWPDCWTGWLNDYMPSFDYENSDVLSWSLDLAKWWIENYNLDGLFIAPQNYITINTKFIGGVSSNFGPANFDERSLVLTTNYNYTHDNNVISPGSGYDGMFNEPLRIGLCNSILYRDPSDSIMGTSDLTNLLNVLYNGDNMYPKGTILLNGINNVDWHRAIHVTEGTYEATSIVPESFVPSQSSDEAVYKLLEVAYAIIYTNPGVPYLFYGDEIGLKGGGYPNNLTMMPEEMSLNVQQISLRDKLKKLANVRLSYPVLRRGTRTVVSTSTHTMVYRLEGNDYDGSSVLVAINRDDIAHDVDLPTGTYTDLINGGIINSGTRSLSARSFLILAVQ